MAGCAVLALGGALWLGTAAGQGEPRAEPVAPAGRAAPAWNLAGWVGSPPLGLDALRGRVVLVRWWTDTCPYCEASVPALRALRDEFAARGLVLVGMYHPKPRGRKVSAADVRAASERLGIDFPVGLDLDWALLERYWLEAAPRRATSVSFLIDRQGRIRHVHPGPLLRLEPRGADDTAHADYLALRAALERLLDEPES